MESKLNRKAIITSLDQAVDGVQGMNGTLSYDGVASPMSDSIPSPFGMAFLLDVNQSK